MTHFYSSNSSLASISVAGREIARNESGLFEVDDCTPEIEFAMINHAGCRHATLDEIGQATAAETAAATEASQRESKKTMIEALIAKGVKVDGRASFDAVLALFEKNIDTSNA
jgi:hypothetical protein